MEFIVLPRSAGFCMTWPLPVCLTSLISAVHFVLGPLVAFLFLDHPSYFVPEDLTPLLGMGLLLLLFVGSARSHLLHCSWNASHPSDLLWPLSKAALTSLTPHYISLVIFIALIILYNNPGCLLVYWLPSSEKVNSTMAGTLPRYSLQALTQ